MTLLENPYILVLMTFAFFFAGKWAQKKTHLVILNPMLLTIAAIIAMLELTGTGYEPYKEAGKYIDFWMKPVIVALGVPLYQQLAAMKKQWMPILASQIAGCLTGIVSVVLIAKGLGASKEVVISIAPKSVTMPIALEVSKATGGIPSITAAVVVTVGILGAIAGFQVMKLMRIKTTEAKGLSMGTASHAIGTSAAMEASIELGAYSSLGLTLNGILTAILTPAILNIIY